MSASLVILPPPARSGLQARQRAALGVVALVLGLHAALLAWWPRAPGPGWRATPLQVRQVVSVAATATAATPAPQAVAAAAEPTPRVPRPTPPAPLRATPETPRPTNVEPEPPAARGETAQETPALPAPPDPAPPPGGQAVPVYATRLPPPATLHYAVRRGAARGHAELRWQPDGERYELTLRTEGFGAQVLGSTSRGALDAHGIAPERLAQLRGSRELRAANFQRDAGRITYSGPSVEHPLLPGSQDRLSWMLQLPAVMAANPDLAAPGSEVALFVAGARGDADVWTFVVVGTETTSLPDGALAGTLHLKRSAQRAYDTQVDVWLDPARGHLPVRTRLQVRPTGEGTEFLLEALAPP